jgi:hypothetical protein
MNGTLRICRLNKSEKTLALAAVIIRVKHPAIIISGSVNNDSLKINPIDNPTNRALYV